jgi:predicted SprT family Zn-dependent metalloprotease
MPDFRQFANHTTPEVHLGYLMVFLTDEQKTKLFAGIRKIIEQGIADPRIVCETRADLAFERIRTALSTYTVSMSNAFALNGQVNYTTLKIRLAGRLLRSEKYESTLFHEIAHVVDYTFFKGRGHGYTWKLCDRAFGGTGQRCTDREPPLEEIMKMPVVYKCPNGHFAGQSRRHSGETSCGRCSRKFDRRFLLKQIKG